MGDQAPGATGESGANGVGLSHGAIEDGVYGRLFTKGAEDAERPSFGRQELVLRTKPERGTNLGRIGK